MAGSGMLPSGLSICCSVPDLFFVPELVFGGLVWILVACTYIEPNNPQAYVMAVSLFCFVVTFLWMIFFLCGTHHNHHSWAAADMVYHAFASLLYISASVLLASVTVSLGYVFNSVIQNVVDSKIYKLDIAAVVFSFVATLLYVLHTIFSTIRWKSF